MGRNLRALNCVPDALGFASGIMARSAGISTFCPCYVIYYFSVKTSAILEELDIFSDPGNVIRIKGIFSFFCLKKPEWRNRATKSTATFFRRRGQGRSKVAILKKQLFRCNFFKSRSVLIKDG